MVEKNPTAPVISAEDDGIRLDRWFKRNMPLLPFATVSKWLRKGQIRVDGKRAEVSDRLVAGQTLRLPPPAVLEGALQEPEQKHSKPMKVTNLRPFVIYEDARLVVLNKPAGLATQGGTGMTTSVDDSLTSLPVHALTPLKLVHRLDKDTSGLLILAKGARWATEFMRQFETRGIKKTYLALVNGVPKQKEGDIKQPLLKKSLKGQEKVRVDLEAGQQAQTHYEVLSSSEGLSLLALKPKTGRMHQLRVHCSHMNWPIVGDGKYGGKAAFPQEGNWKLHLHAWQLILPAMSGIEAVTVTAPLPDFFEQSMKEFGLTFRTPSEATPKK